MQVRNIGNDRIIRADIGCYLVRKDGEEIPKNPNYPEDYKITTLIVPETDVELYEEKSVEEIEVENDGDNNIE